MSAWQDVEEVEAFKPILVSWGNKVRNNLYYLKSVADKAFLIDGTRSMQGNIVPALNASYDLGSSTAQWRYLYISGTTGAGGIVTSNTRLCANLNADMVDGRHAGNAFGNVAVNNNTLNSGLNADMVDGRHAGNEIDNVAVNNYFLNAGLNADMVDSYHVGNSAWQIPVSNGTRCVDLNADMVDGKHVWISPYGYYGEARNVNQVYWFPPTEQANNAKAVQVFCHILSKSSTGNAYVGFTFYNYNTGTSFFYRYEKATANNRLHNFYITLQHESFSKRYPFFTISYRDTANVSEIITTHVSLTNYPAELYNVFAGLTTGYCDVNMLYIIYF